MGKELTILALGAVFLFGWFYFTKQGCNGKLNGLTGVNEATGETGSLCYTGKDIFGQNEEDTGSAPAPDSGGVDYSKPLGVTLQEADKNWPTPRSTPNCNGATGKCVCANGTRKIQMKPGETCGDCIKKCGASSGYARSYYVNNQITVA